MQQLNRSQNLDVKLLNKSMQMTIDFEAGLNRRYTQLAADQNALLAMEVPNFFTGKISLAFEPFLRLNIEAEDK